MTPVLEILDLSKTFTLHLRGGIRLPVLDRVSLSVQSGSCVALVGPSGSGKSTLMRCVFGNYRADSGSILLRHDSGATDLVTASPRSIASLRRTTIGYVSQFLRVIPRVPTLDIVAAPLRAAGIDERTARTRAGEMLERLHIPARLWDLPPATFSGGEQQRVNLARGLILPRSLVLLDEPTASLDPVNASVVLGLIRDACAHGTAALGIFHDAEARAAVASEEFALQPPIPLAA